VGGYPLNDFIRYLNTSAKRRAFKREYRIDFYRAMYLYQRAGARKLETLTKLADTFGSHLSAGQRIGNRIAALLGTKQRPFVPTIAKVANTGILHSSLPLSDALRDWLPAAEQAILAAGESAGNLAQACQMAGKFARQQGGMWRQVVGAFAYPLFLILGVMGILYLIASFVMPSMDITRTDIYTPFTQLVMFAAQTIHDYWLLALILPVLTTIAIALSLSRWCGAWRTKADRFAPWSFYRRIQGALFLYSFAILQKSGLPLQGALAILASTATPYLKSRINAAMYGVRQGYNLGESFRHAGHEFPDWEALPVLESMSSQSGFADALIEYAENWLDDTTYFIEKFSKRANSIGMIWVLLWIALLMSTIFELISMSFRY